MNRHRRVVAVVLIVVATAYVLLFVPPNLTGAKDPNMLATFQVDEWIQYPYLMSMTTAGRTAGETLRNALVYGHYYYGYPFYVTSALAILPLRAAAGFAPLAPNWKRSNALEPDQNRTCVTFFNRDHSASSSAPPSPHRQTA